MSIYMDARAKILMRWLLERVKAEPRYGYTIRGIANEMGWTYDEVHNAIAYVRNEASQSGNVIICWKDGSRWYYKAPSDPEEAEEYLRDWRAKTIAVLLSHVLFLVRKSRAYWGGSDALALMQTHLIAAMQEMVRMETPGAQQMLTKALRPIEESNGHAA